jgi:iron complex outermembrane receptor protein
MRTRTLSGNRYLAIVSSVSASALLSSAASAQQPIELPGIFVDTSTRLEIGTSDKSGITGSSTSVITREQIERAPQATLADIIAQEAGVQSSSLYGGVNGAGTKVDLRGFGATGPSNTLVLINGRRLNDWDLPGFDLSSIPRESVERIEITRGSSGAVLYGDGAVGGVINIVTKGGPGLPNQFRVEGGVGSFNTITGNISTSGSSGVFSYFVNGNGFASEGYRSNNEIQQESIVGDFRWTFAKGSVYLNIAADDQHLGLPGERRVFPAGVNEVRDDPRGTHTPFDYADKQGARGTAGFTYMIGQGLELIVDGGIRTKAQQAAFFSPFEEQYVDTDLTTSSLTPRLVMMQPVFGLPSRILTGIDFYDTDYESRRSMFKGLAPIHIYNGGQQSLAGYWMHTLSVLPTTDISTGGRLQWNNTTASDRYDPLAPQGFPGLQGLPLDKDETNHAWHVGIEHKLAPGITVLGRVAQSFRIANIDERIGSALFGFPTTFDLRTQKSHDWEAGARFQKGPFSIQSTYYEMRLTDELHFDPINFINTNLDPTFRRGVETNANWQVLKNLRLYGNLTYTDATFREGPNAGNQVPVVSRWTGNIGLSWSLIDKMLTFDSVVRYVGDRRMDNDQANFQPAIPAYTTVDLRLSGEIETFFWSAGVQNIFDADYFDYAVASTFTLGRYNAYTQPGRTFFVKAGVTW